MPRTYQTVALATDGRTEAKVTFVITTPSREIPMSATNDLTQAALQLLTLLGVRARRVNNGAVYDVKRKAYRKNPQAVLGIPDICGHFIGSGRAVYIEIKTGRDKTSAEQDRFIAEALADGCCAGVARSLDDVQRIVKEGK